jgi:hypothetical protein
MRDPTPARGSPLFQRVLGESWHALAPPIQQLHDVRSSATLVGHCTVRRGRHPLARLMAFVNGFPREGANLPMEVQLRVEGDGERWVRTCGGRRFSSTQRPGRGRFDGLVGERFGPVSVYMALQVEDSSLRYLLRRWTLFGISLPLGWGPRSAALESTQDGLFKFDVEISHALTGLIVHYVGTLSPRNTRVV